MDPIADGYGKGGWGTAQPEGMWACPVCVGLSQTLLSETEIIPGGAIDKNDPNYVDEEEEEEKASK